MSSIIDDLGDGEFRKYFTVGTSESIQAYEEELEDIQKAKSEIAQAHPGEKLDPYALAKATQKA